MSLRDPAVLLPRAMNDRDQPVAILADIEDHIPLYVIGILEDLLHIHEILPPCRLRDFVPGLNLLSGVGVLFFSLDEMLASDDIHRGIQNVLLRNRHRKIRCTYKDTLQFAQYQE